MNRRTTLNTSRAVPSLSRQTPSPRPLSPFSMTLFKPAPLTVWKTGGLFDEDVLPAEMQDADIGQIFCNQQRDDVGTILSMIDVADSHQANVGTVDWSQLTDSKHWADESFAEEDSKFTAIGDLGKKSRPRVTCFKLPVAMAEVKSSRPASPCPISNLDLPADLLQRLIAESGVFDDGIGSLPTPPPVVENPLGLLASPTSAPDHAMYVKKRRLSSTGSCDDGASTVFSAAPSAGDSMHDDKYLERRRKNNIASRRSRELRKRKMETMEVRAEELERENKTLRARVEELERTTRLMKELLLQRLSLPTTHQGGAAGSSAGHLT